MLTTVSSAPVWLRRLRWAGIVLPVLAIIFFQAAQMAGGRAVDPTVSIISLVAVVAFGVAMFALLERGYRLIEYQNRELAGTNAILTAMAQYERLSLILDQVHKHVIDLLRVDNVHIDLPQHCPAGQPPHHPAEPADASVSVSHVMLRGSRIGSIRVRREQAMSDHEHRLMETAADMISLAVAQDGVLEHERHLARVDELDRIARELHDSLAQVLGTLHLRLRAIPHPVEDHAEQVRDEIDALGDLCHGAYQDVREAIVGLRSLTGSGTSLTEALREYATYYSRLGGPATVLEIDGTELNLDPATRLHLLRIVQEALTNTRKHADAGQVRIVLRGDVEGHDILVEDDGRGFTPECERHQDDGYGLQTMHERSVLIGATLTVQSQPGTGTKVSIRLPRHSTGTLQ